MSCSSAPGSCSHCCSLVPSTDQGLGVQLNVCCRCRDAEIRKVSDLQAEVFSMPWGIAPIDSLLLSAFKASSARIHCSACAETAMLYLKSPAAMHCQQLLHRHIRPMTAWSSAPSKQDLRFMNGCEALRSSTTLACPHRMPFLGRQVSPLRESDIAGGDTEHSQAQARGAQAQRLLLPGGREPR